MNLNLADPRVLKKISEIEKRKSAVFRGREAFFGCVYFVISPMLTWYSNSVSLGILSNVLYALGYATYIGRRIKLLSAKAEEEYIELIKETNSIKTNFGQTSNVYNIDEFFGNNPDDPKDVN